MDFTLKDLMEIALSFITGSGLAFHFTKKYYTKILNKNKQIQNSGNNSYNYQAGKDISIGYKK